MKELIEEYGEDSYTIIIGQNAKDNDELLKKYGHTDYIWFHLKSYSSSHVVILHNNPPLEILEAAAIACKDSTKYRNIRNLKVLYTKNIITFKKQMFSDDAVNFKSNSCKSAR